MGEDYPRTSCDPNEKPRLDLIDNTPMLSMFLRLGDTVTKRETVILDGESLDINSVVAASRYIPL